MNPTRAGERLPLLDAVRGAALGGILLANLMSFFGAEMLGAPAREALAWHRVGERVLFTVNWLVEGKFYSVFSILLGVGFALQARRAEGRGMAPRQFEAFFRRRMLVLAGIGLVHLCVFWSGDILTLYGLMGLLLPAAWRLPVRLRCLLIVALLATPLAVHGLVLRSGGARDPRAPFAAAGEAVRTGLGIAGRPAIEAFAHDGARDYWAWNLASAVTRPGTYLQSGRPAKVLALFLIGAWLGAGALPRLAALQPALWMTTLLGGISGLGASYVYASIKADTGSTFLLSATGLVQTAAYTIGTTPLALAYLAAAALAWRTPRARAALAWFVPLGRMALTVYLTQTIVQLLVFSGVGLGLAGRLPIALLPATALILLSAQRTACVWWLRGHPQGPAEWVWRRATYGRRAITVSA